MTSYFKILDDQTFRFNDIAGNNSKHSQKDFQAQFKVLAEEVNELGNAIDANDMTEVLDGVIDVLVVAAGFAHRLEEMGVDMLEAVERVTDNNLSKFPIRNTTEILNTIGKYSKEGVVVNERSVFDMGKYGVHARSVFVDDNGKIRKPFSFEPVTLSDLVEDIAFEDSK